MQAHLGSPDFFDLERYPEITFRSTSIRRHGDEVIIDGDLTIKGNEAFDEDGGLKDGDTSLALDSVIAELLDAAKRRLVA